MKLIPTFIYGIKEPTVYNKTRIIKGAGLTAIIAGVISLIVGDRMDKNNIECWGD